MRILFVYPSLNSVFGYPTGVGYIIALLKQKGHAARLFNVFAKSDIARLIIEADVFKPEVIAFSCVTTQFKWICLMAILLKMKMKSLPLIICGGIHPTLEPDCLSKCSALDGIVRGEGEYPMLELAEKLESKQDYRHIKNFHFRDGSSIIRNELRPLVQNLDGLPFPDRTNINYRGDIFSNFIFSRGCPFRCKYCSNHALKRLYKGKYVRFRNPEKAVAEIERAIKHDPNLRFIRFDDDIVSVNKEWMRRFLKLYKRRRIAAKFSCNVAAGTADLEDFKLLKASGCIEVRIGIESGDECLRREVLGKPISNAQIKKAFENAHEAGLRTFSFNMIGLPYETPELFEKTIRINRMLKVDMSYLYIFHPYPGTDLRSVCIKEGFIDVKEDNSGTFEFIERQDTILNMPAFPRETILKYFRNFYRLVRE
jgi:radical SAM superfamily enzyme YgiQ (UPF0313 family)